MSKAWQKLERMAARSFGGERRGPVVSGLEGEGLSDSVGTEPYAIECKLRTKPSYTDCRAAVEQAEQAAEGTPLCPIAVIHRKGDRYSDALVILKFSTFCDWFGPLFPGQTDVEGVEVCQL